MRGGAVIRGVVGQIKWSYYVAAAINGYTVSRGPDGQWSVRALVVHADKLKMSQKPLIFVAPHQHGEWRWPILDLQLHESVLTAHLGTVETYVAQSHRST